MAGAATAVMTEEEAAAKLRLLELEEEEVTLQSPGSTAHTPYDGPEPSALSKTKHALKGLGETAVNMTVDLPHNLSVMGGMLEKAVRHANYGSRGSELPDIVPTIPRLSDKPYIKPVADALSSEEFPRGASPPADTVRTALEWGAGGIPNFFRKVSTRPDLWMAAFASAGQVLEDYFSEGDESGLGEVAGGITGLVAALRKGKTDHLPAEVQRAFKFIKGAMDDPAKAEAKLQKALANGEKGTLADLMQDQGAFNVEAGVARTPKMSNKIDDRQVERGRQILDEIEAPFGTANPDLAAEAAKARAAERKAGVRINTKMETEAAQQATAPALDDLSRQANESTEAALAAREAAEAAEAARVRAGKPLETTQRPAEASTRVKNVTDEAEQVFKETVEQPAWKAFEAQDAFSIRPIQEAISAKYKAMSSHGKKLFDKEYGSLFNVLKGKGDILPADMQSILRQMKGKVSQAIENGTYTDQTKELSAFIDEIEKSLSGSNDLFKAAKAATTEKYTRFRPGKLDKTRKAAPERYAGRLGYADEAGAETARLQQGANIPALPEANLAMLKALGVKEGVTPKFLSKYAEQLDALPAGQRQQFDNFVETAEAQKAAAAVAKKAEAADTSTQLKTLRERNRLEKALAAEEAKIGKKGEVLKEAVDKTLAAKYGTSPNKTLDGILKSKDPVADLKRLNKKLTSLGQGDSLKNHVGRLLKERLLKNPSDDLNKALVESKVLTIEEVNDITRAVNKTKSVAMRKKALEVHKELLGGSEFRRLISSGGAAAALTLLPSSHSLIMAGALRRYFWHFMKNAKTPKEVKALEEFTLNPESFLDAAKGIKDGEIAARRILSKTIGAENAAALIAEMGEEDDGP